MFSIRNNSSIRSIRRSSNSLLHCLSKQVTNHLISRTIMSSPSLIVKRLSKNAILPTRASKQAAGYDLSSAYDYIVPAHGKELVKTDLAMIIPDGYYGRIAPRSGLAWKNHIDVGAGVIDADYRGNVGVVLFNHSNKDFEIKAGDRVAQLLLEKIITPEVVEVDDLEATERGEGGFGHTGVSEKIQPQ